MDFIFESFPDIYTFQRTINKRQNNYCMEGVYYSQEGTEDFTGTKSYEQAEDLLYNGWKNVLDKIKVELKRINTAQAMECSALVKSARGFAPSVPDAIRGLPKSMFTTKRVQENKERNAINIVYHNNCSCCDKSDDTIKAGIVILKLCKLLDMNNIRTKIDLISFCSRDNQEQFVTCFVKIKDYRQTFNLLKVAYPLGHTSFYRRQGFKWLETTTQSIKRSSSFRNHYGYTPNENDLIKNIDEAKKRRLVLDNNVYIKFTDIQECKYDINNVVQRFIGERK